MKLEQHRSPPVCNTLIALALAGCFGLANPAMAQPVSAPVAAQTKPAFATGTNWLVSTTTELNGLTIPEGVKISAPPGKSLTMTVDGINMPVSPGTHSGKVVLSVTDPIIVKYKELDPHSFRAAIYVEDGRYVPSRSVAAAARGARISDSAASGAAITSREESFNGIVVSGNSKYTINDPVIDFTGNGGNDFAGFGAAIMSSGSADVTVNNPKIRSKGAVRTAIFVGGDSIMRINNADIEVFNGTLPAGYKFNIDMGKMKEVPWMLGLSGNVRATNLVAHGTVYYTNSRIRAQGWGALSTDDAAVVRMYVKDSLIETLDSGYGAYSIGDSLDHFSHSTLNVADIGLIMAAQGSGTFTDGTVVNSRRYGVMMHSGGGGTLTLDKGSVINSRLAGIEVKGRGGNVIIDNAQIHAGNGVILQAMINDDPFAMGAGPIVGVQGPGILGCPPGGPGCSPGAGAPSGGPPGGMMPAGSPDVVATLRNTTLAGDFINTRTAQGDLTVKLDKATVKGAISTGIQAPVSGKAPTQETYWQIGDVVNTLAPSKDKNGVVVSVGAGSQWLVTKTSYLTQLNLAQGGSISAPPGYRLSMKVDGKPTPLAAKTYKGNIELLVAAL